MRMEFLAVGLGASPNHRRFDLVAQVVECWLLVHPGPDAAQLCPAAEMADPGEAHGEAWRSNSGQRGIDVVELRPVHLADEAQRQVKILRRRPAGARQAAAEQAQ